MVCGPADLRRCGRSRALAPRRTAAGGGRGDHRPVRATRGALRCAWAARVRRCPAGDHRSAAAARRAGGQRGGLARSAVARPVGDRDGGIRKRAAEDKATPHLGPVWRAVRIETVPPAALGRQSRAGTGALPYRAIVSLCPTVGGGVGISPGRWRAARPGGRSRLGSQGGERLGIHVASSGSVLRAGALVAGGGQEGLAGGHVADPTRPAGVPG